ncbi:MAG: hypothetical protein GY719_05815 [bacterium]|nr:hypothetical protein [bacterium]
MRADTLMQQITSELMTTFAAQVGQAGFTRQHLEQLRKTFQQAQELIDQAYEEADTDRIREMEASLEGAEELLEGKQEGPPMPLIELPDAEGMLQSIIGPAVAAAVQRLAEVRGSGTTGFSADEAKSSFAAVTRAHTRFRGGPLAIAAILYLLAEFIVTFVSTSTPAFVVAGTLAGIAVGIVGGAAAGIVGVGAAVGAVAGAVISFVTAWW